MQCIFCTGENTEVVETRVLEEGATVRRRRECSTCKRRFTTYERVDQLPLIVIKRDGKRERFDRDKLKAGILKSVEKTTVTMDQVESVVMTVESHLKQEETTEIASSVIGNLVAKELKKIDKIAYIRFASVFRRFLDVEDFEREIKKLL
ncbi:transcriptional regulator NrdR [Candidatus Roizmanbacteria bacterium RIFCSPLOWO2_02_FULL_39_8]|uniref:Transcriptional repressor NrdR n=1 Tax=Candidatus Roizmanbacteria bacterium RIFCSPHIGHO2_01_FULL_39_24 TaxID=1802032 RepID=A0A1F7GHY1_9BACT|nr:MAG: transcriptional regulator NrdR [Candidatus Roizmanbacteria bacterium RIFCSPHIGHO2_01_FULL_39_24]OGK49729.1 MAG: transcriptional regulator NrdR [Candidatus Roizmanbacteria bacterium RIFCSPLOWO2_01_FULL_40_32]OGK56569.1 MAG: transcriptional regulator NrdR [Candidatus Roizmanbacteria bacterium RIFCSPLOWO2_02_FULL_39_8]